MNDRRLRFAEGILAGKSIMDAYVEAGYSPIGCKPGGSRLLRVPEVAEYIRRRQAQTAARNNVTLDEIVDNFREIRTRCLQQQPLLTRKGTQVRGDVEVTCPECQAEFAVTGDIWTFDANGANTANTQLGRVIAAFTDKTDTVSEETKRGVNRLLTAQDTAIGRLVEARFGKEAATELVEALPGETKAVLGESKE